MSLAWATVASSAASVAIGFYLWRDLSIFRLSLKDWRGVLSFGVFGSTIALLNTTSDALVLSDRRQDAQSGRDRAAAALASTCQFPRASHFRRYQRGRASFVFTAGS